MPSKPFHDAIENIRASISIGALADSLSLTKLRRTGVNHSACCPFHEDRTPSLTLYEDTGTYHCFACDAHGDTFALVQKMRSCDFAEAVRWLADYTHTPLPSTLPASHRQSGLSLAAKAYANAASKGRSVLKKWTEDERRLDMSTVNKAGLVGITSPVLTTGRRDGAYLAGWERWEWNALEEAGLVRTRQRKGGDAQGTLPLTVPEDVFWYEGILFPMNAPTGVLTGFAVGKTKSSKYEGPKYRYSSGFKRSECLYGLDRLYARFKHRLKKDLQRLDVFLVEGLVDVLRMESVGLDALGVLGNSLAGTVAEEGSQIHRLWSLKLRYPDTAMHVHIFFDSDNPGQQGMYRTLRKLLPLQAEDPLFVVDCIVPDISARGKDPDELLLEYDADVARACLQDWAISSARFTLARILDAHPSTLDALWTRLTVLQKVQVIARCSRLFAMSQHAAHPHLLCSGGLPAKPIDDSETEWAIGLMRPLVTPKLSALGSARAQRIPAVERDEGFSKALFLARESYSDIDFAIDTGSWARLELGGELVWPLLQERLEKCRGPIEPFSATLTPRFDGGQPRLKTLPAPEDLVLENFVLGHFLRFGIDNPKSIPLVVHYRETGVTATIGPPEILPMNSDTVSFAYQFNQNAFGAGNAQATGLFRHFSDCWHGFIDFILNRLQRLPDSVEKVYVARLDIRRYYDCLSRTTVLDVLGPALREGIEVAGEGVSVIPFLDDASLPQDDRVSRLRNWMVEGRTFGYSWYAPDDGRTTIWPDPDRGIPQGPNLSSWLANIALFPLDRRLTEVVEAINRERLATADDEIYATYARYVDDIVIVAPSKTDFDMMRLAFSGWLESKGLQLSKKVGAFPPMDRTEVQSWLLQNRGLAERASGDWALPESPIEIVGSFGRLGGGKMDRHDALVLLHSTDATDPTLAREDAIVLIETVSQSSVELRYADYRAMARNLWSAIVAETTQTDADLAAVAREYWSIWRNSVIQGIEAGSARAVPGGVDGLARAIERYWPLMVCIEAIQKVLTSRRDRNPLLPKESHRVGTQIRKRLASMVLQGLVDELIDMMPGSNQDGDCSTDDIATMLLARRLTLYRVAALVAGNLALSARNSAGFSNMRGAVDPGSYRLALSSCPSGVLQTLAPYSSAVGECGDRRAILLFHEAIERLRHSGPAANQSEDPLRPIGAAVGQQVDAAAPSDLDKALGLLIARDSGDGTEDGIAIRVLNVFARAVPPLNQLQLLEWRKPLVGAFNLGSRFSIIPTPEGLATVALFVVREGTDGQVERCCVITLKETGDDDAPSLAPENLYPLPVGEFEEWQEESALSEAPSLYRCYAAVRVEPQSTKHWKRSGQVAMKTDINVVDLLLIAKSFRQLYSLPMIGDVVLTHAHLLTAQRESVALFSWFDTLGQLAGKACTARSDGQGSLLVDVPEHNDWIWRIGYAVIAHAGLSWLVDQSEDCRITRPASEDLGEWAASNLAHMAARSLTGTCWWSKPAPSDAESEGDEENVLPRVVTSCLSRLSAFAEMDKGAVEYPIRAVGLVLGARTDNAMMRELFETRAFFDRPGIGPLVLSRLANCVVRADEGLIDLLATRTACGSMQLEAPLRRTVEAYRELFRRILVVRDHLDDSQEKKSLVCLANSVAIMCISAQLRAFVMETTTTHVKLRSVSMDHADSIRAWPLDGTSLLSLNLDPAGSGFDAVVSLAERFDLSRSGASSIHSHGEYAKITPLGLAVLWRLMMLHADRVQSFAGTDDDGLSSLLLESFSSSIVPARGNYPWGYLQPVDEWSDMQGLDDTLHSLVGEELGRGLVVKNDCQGRNPVAGHGRDSVDLLSASGDEWRVDACQFLRASLPGEKPSDYERTKPKSGPWQYKWSESWYHGHLVGASMVSAMFGALLVHPPSAQSKEQEESLPQPETEPDTSDAEGGNSHRESVSPRAAEGTPPASSAPYTSDSEVPGDNLPSQGDAREIIRLFRRNQGDLWDSRSQLYGNHVRLALYQFEVDETYSHPLSEACVRGANGSLNVSIADSKSRMQQPLQDWPNREDRFSCAEARRRCLLDAALRACNDLNVEILLLPEYSVRPETLNWMAERLDRLGTDMRVWAGTFRIPSAGMDSSAIHGTLGPDMIANLFHSSAAVLSIVSRHGVEAARGKRYPAVALGEQFKPFLNDRQAITPLFSNEPTAGRPCSPGHFVTELICSEIFMATSPANLNSITQSLRQIYEMYAPSRLGSDLSYISEAVLGDLQNFADHTSMAPRYLFRTGSRNAWEKYPRRTLLLVPSMTTRSVDFHILGQANYLAAGICMAFCNAVCSPFAKGESCFIGQGATNGDSNHRYYDERIGPYNGLHPGVYRDGCFRKGVLGEKEQALVVVDVDPLYMNEGRPRHQLLQPPLSLVAHLPVIEYASEDYLNWKILHATSIRNLRAQCSCTSRRRTADRGAVESIVQRVMALCESTRAEPDLSTSPTANAEARNEIVGILDSLAQLQPATSPWLTKRHDAFRDSYALIRSPWLPPAVYDFLLVETDYAIGADEEERGRLSIEIPPIDPNLDAPFEP